MKPTNAKTPPCNPTSSDCVVWTGPDLECIDLCTGDTVSSVIYKLACQLCDVLDELNVDNYDLSCLNLSSCAPPDFQALLQLLINKICELNDINPSTAGGASGCPNCVVNLPSCFQYNDPKTGDLVVTGQLVDLVQASANQICSILAQITTNGKATAANSQRIAALEAKPAPTFVLPNISPVCVLPNTPTPIDVVLVALETQYCELRSATGTTTQIFNGIAMQPAGLNQSPALGTSGGTMSGIIGWNNSPSSLGDAFGNMWLTIADLRSAITNIQLTCCSSSCQGISIQLQAVMTTPTTLVLFPTGSVPTNLTQCSVAGTMFTIADQSGHFINVTFDLVANLNNPSGYPITLASTPINTSDDLTISSTLCFKDDAKGSVCQSVLEYVYVNTSICPTVPLISHRDSIDYLFTHTAGTVTYVLSLYDSTGTVLIQAQTFTESNPRTVSGTFSALSEGTTYQLKVSIITSSKTVTCPSTVVTTLPNACSPASGVSAVISIS